MKPKIKSLYILLLMVFGYASAQDVITVTANDSEISDNLDLQAVASIFGDSKNLEDFEYRLNDPYTQISNLDLNRDGYVDYLRVVELSKNYTHLIVVQAVIGRDLYQDVATIEVERDRYGVSTVQVVGNAYIYGPNYIIEPVYVYRPMIIVWFWGPYYRPWQSPYYWSYYPHYFRPWHPYHPHVYRTNVYMHINIHNTYHYSHVRKCGSAVNMYHQVGRNDYGNRYPEKSFTKRNKGITNRSGLNSHRGVSAGNSNGQARPPRSEKRKDYKRGEARTVDYDQRVKASHKDKVATTRPYPAKQRPPARKGNIDQNGRKHTAPIKVNTHRPVQKQQDRVSRSNRSPQAAESSYGQTGKKQSAYSSATGSRKPAKQTFKPREKKVKAGTQSQTIQTRKNNNLKSQAERR